ncbi:MAG: hypothetical protein K8F34_05195 [Candidatus Kuenenia stuttgartiensis]|nr:hypothetical protein [Candidatus Kuenenia stuttgartiensis]GJQ48028.1 MAG: hypothetical protein HKUEN01_04140 [Candidatus Kuenenia stuttgartiensis]
MKPAKNLPEPVQWLLDFANIGCISGEPNPRRFKSYHTHTFHEYTTNEHIPKLKRSPVELLPPKKEKDTFCELPTDEQRKRFEEEIENLKPGETISHSLPLHQIITKFKEIGAKNKIIHDGYIISISESGEPVFEGKHIELFPLIADFCTKEGIMLEVNCDHVLSHKKCNYSMANTWWHVAQAFFNRVLQENNGEDVHPFNETAFDYAKKNKPEHELSKQIHDGVWDFWNNHRSLHSRLRQCVNCGAFWIEPNMVKKGKPRAKFCADECGYSFHKPSREKDRETHIRANKVLKSGTKKEIVEFLLKNRGEGGKQLTKARAEEIYKAVKQISPKTVSSLKQFVKSYHAHKPRVMLKALHHRDNKE